MRRKCFIETTAKCVVKVRTEQAIYLKYLIHLLFFLSLEQNKIKDKGVEAMAQALSICPYIKVIR